MQKQSSMAQSVVAIPYSEKTREILEEPLAPQPSKSKRIVVDKTLGSAANLAKLLPSGTLLAFQALAPSFANRGECYASNKALVGLLIFLCSLTSLFFSITDSLKGPDGKIYYGIATFKGMYVLNYGEEDEKFGDLKRYRLRVLDYVHAFFTMLIFQSLAFGDSDVQRCLFKGTGPNVEQLLKNLPLGAAVLSGLVFMTFPTERKGIGFSDSEPHAHQ